MKQQPTEGDYEKCSRCGDLIKVKKDGSYDCMSCLISHRKPSFVKSDGCQFGRIASSVKRVIKAIAS